MKPNIHHTRLRVATVLAVSAMALGLAACDKLKEPTVGERLDSAVEKTEQAAGKAKVEAQQAVDAARAKMEEGAAKVEATAQTAGSSAVALVDDAAVTVQVSSGLAQDPALSAIKINVDTKGGVVTLTGPAPSQEAKDRATTIAQGVKGVTSVVNQLVVKAS